jgi:hypothetical protein
MVTAEKSDPKKTARGQSPEVIEEIKAEVISAGYLASP